MVSKRLGVSLEGHHRAVNDAEATAEIFLKLVDMLEENDIKNIIAEEQSTRNNKDALENFKYAEYITSIAKKINTRQLNIINVLDTRNNRPTVENMYKTHMKELYQKLIYSIKIWKSMQLCICYTKTSKKKILLLLSLNIHLMQ